MTHICINKILRYKLELEGANNCFAHTQRLYYSKIMMEKLIAPKKINSLPLYYGPNEMKLIEIAQQFLFAPNLVAANNLRVDAVITASNQPQPHNVMYCRRFVYMFTDSVVIIQI
jgi:hypothetical protein